MQLVELECSGYLLLVLLFHLLIFTFYTLSWVERMQLCVLCAISFLFPVCSCGVKAYSVTGSFLS